MSNPQPPQNSTNSNTSSRPRADSNTVASCSFNNAAKLAEISRLNSFASSNTLPIEAFSLGLQLESESESESPMGHDGAFVRSSHSLTSPARTTQATSVEKPIPARIMTVLCFVIFCEPVSLTILFPFIYFMVRDFGISSEKDVGFYVGFIASSFSLAQFLTSLLWGWVSDRVGRRPVLLIGLLGNSISLIMFGQSHSLQAAIFSRMLCGFLNGNIGIAKCVIGEITTPTTQAFGFSLIGIMWSLGTIIGPILGGCLSNPVTQFPSWFGGNEFLTRNPYFLPCGVSACVSAIGFVIGYFCLEETNPKMNGGYIPVSADDEEGTGCGLLSADGEQENAFKKSNTSNENRLRDSVETMVDEEQPSSSSSLEIEDCCQGNRLTPSQVMAETNCAENSTTEQSIATINFGKVATMNIVAYSLLAFQNIILEEAFSLWIVTSPLDGGLGYTSAQVGIVLSIIGALALYMQLILYPQLSRAYKPLTLFRAGAILYVGPYLFYPVLSGTLSPLFGNKTTIVWVLLVLLLAARQFCNVLTYTSVFILINNSAAPGSLGLVNGIAQTSASFVRSIGPALGGIMWAWSITNGRGFPFNYWFVFVVVTVSALGLAVQSFYIPECEDAGAGETGEFLGGGGH